MRLIGVKIKKYIIDKIIGAIILPSTSPSFIQILFKGVKNLEFNIPSNKKKNRNNY